MTALDQQYKISQAVITADRFGDLKIDVSQLIYELTIFESVEKPYLTGNVVLVDNVGLFESIKFKGTEYINIILSSIKEEEDKLVEKTFIMSNMIKSVKSNDATETLMFHLIEVHNYKNSLIPFSRSYTDNFPNIITKIINTALKLDVDISYLSDKSKGLGQRRLIVPYMTPLEACEWILDKACTPTGSPLFLYSSIHDDRIRLGDLDKMLTQKPFNEKLPYIYSQAATQTATELDEGFRASQILSYSLTSNQNSLEFIDQGCVGAFHTNTDLGTGLSYRSHISSNNAINALKEQGSLSKGSEQLLFDDQQKFENTPVEAFNSVYFHQLSSSNTYGSYKSYHDEDNAAGFSLNVKNKTLKSALYKNMMGITVSGTMFMLAKATVGDVARVHFTSSNPENNVNEPLDPEKSGDYLIYASRHTFRDTSHTVSLDVTRISKDKKGLMI